MAFRKGEHHWVASQNRRQVRNFEPNAVLVIAIGSERDGGLRLKILAGDGKTMRLPRTVHVGDCELAKAKVGIWLGRFIPITTAATSTTEKKDEKRSAQHGRSIRRCVGLILRN